MTKLLPRNFIPSSIFDDFRAFYYGEVEKELLNNIFWRSPLAFIISEID